MLVDGLGAFLFDSIVGDPGGDAFVSLNWGWRLRPTHFFQGCDDVGNFGEDIAVEDDAVTGCPADAF